MAVEVGNLRTGRAWVASLPLAALFAVVGAGLVHPAVWNAAGRSFGDGFLREVDLSTCPDPDPLDVDNHLARREEESSWWCYGPAPQVGDWDGPPRVHNLYVPDTNLPWVPDVWERHPFHPNALAVVRVDGLKVWMAEHPEDRCEESVRLVVNGFTMTGLLPTLCDPEDGIVLFQVHNLDLFDEDVAPDAEVGWRQLLDSRAHLTWTVAQVSLSWGDGQPLPTLIRGTQAATLVFISPASALLSVSGAFLSILLLWTFGRSSTLLRVTGSSAERPGPWSLRRVQAAWWFLVIFTSWEILAAFSRDIPPIGTTSLLLLGIAGGTYSAELVIPAIQDDVAPDVPSRGFLGDLISDARGPVLHRVQMVLWSLALGFAFVYMTVAKLRMPELDETLLALMGLSAAGYLSGKTREARHTTEGGGGQPA
jgi:hypothetical protein